MKPKSGKQRQFQENIYKTTSQLSELVRSVIKDKKEIMHITDLRHKSTYQGDFHEVIEEIEKKKQDPGNVTQKDDDSPYENYEYRNDSSEKKSKFGQTKTLDDRTQDYKAFK